MAASYGKYVSQIIITMDADCETEMSFCCVAPNCRKAWREGFKVDGRAPKWTARYGPITSSN